MITITPTEERKRSMDDDYLLQVFQKRRPSLNFTVPDFKCDAYYQESLQTLSLSDILQEYHSIILFFYERDFTNSAINDILQVRECYKEFMDKKALPIMISTDTAMVHRGFCSSSIQGGLNTVPEFPLLGDATRLISRHFDVLENETGNARRSVFVIDHHHKIKYSFMPLDSEQPYSMSVILSMVSNITK
ncbi:thioredoxin-like protein [Halteromyces radiatus]|uniref:thioredoxin-like protein n=1 Tax=Halteromyces radiatus TaxID=101107 RepID=UPI00221EBBA1|nr:thioredoxin-like protein [Halteromyces radiatus]KAI8088805.1 thioredoxin-like protein [Halteromyces radiatus]